MKDRNDDGGNIENTAKTFELTIVNTFFEKKVSQFVTCNSGENENMIDFLMCKRCHLNEVID